MSDDDIIIIRRNQISTNSLTVDEVSRLREIEAKGDAPLSLIDRAAVARIVFLQAARP